MAHSWKIQAVTKDVCERQPQLGFLVTKKRW